MVSRNIPQNIKRKVRKASYYGCIRCGNPIVDYHHIEQFSEVKKHEENNIVLLCPNCHREATIGTYFKEKVYKDKRNPFNKKTKNIHNQLILQSFSKMVLKLGTNQFQNTPVIIKAFNQNILYFNIDEDGDALLNAVFYDNQNNLIAKIVDNEWIAYIDENLWDIEYKPGHLIIKNDKNSILLEFKVENFIILINASMNINGFKIICNNDAILFDGTNIKECYVQNCFFNFCDAAISIHNSNQTFTAITIKDM